MSTKRDERLDIGRRLFHKEMSFDEARRTYLVSNIMLRNWISGALRRFFCTMHFKYETMLKCIITAANPAKIHGFCRI